MKNKTTITVLISLGLALSTWMLLVFLADISYLFPSVQRIFVMLGGSMSGYIQLGCYFAFFYGYLELRKKGTFINEQYDGFGLNILPDGEQLVLTPEEVGEIKLSVIDLNKRGISYLVTDFIKKACTQYRNDNSVSETLQVLDVQIENNKEEAESGLSIVRYMLNAIMSLGFIGTLLGLTTAIGNAHLAKSEEGMPILTGYLNSAFDTTLVALLLGLILNYFYHMYIAKLDGFYAQSKTYILDNLVSRIYNPVG